MLDQNAFHQTEMNYDLSLLIEDVIKGKLSEKAKKTLYSKVFEELTVCDGVLRKGDWVVFPPKLIKMVIELAQESHGLSETKTIRYLRKRVGFPNLSKSVK